MNVRSIQYKLLCKNLTMFSENTDLTQTFSWIISSHKFWGKNSLPNIYNIFQCLLLCYKWEREETLHALIETPVDSQSGLNILNCPFKYDIRCWRGFCQSERWLKCSTNQEPGSVDPLLDAQQLSEALQCPEQQREGDKGLHKKHTQTQSLAIFTPQRPMNCQKTD